MSSLPDCGTSESASYAPTPTGSSWLGLLDGAYQRLRNASGDEEQVRDAMDTLFLGLRQQRHDLSLGDWQTCIRSCRCHPLRHLVHQDPFTQRAYSKPRGYAGDARLLDFIYGREERWPPPSATPLGHRIFDYTTLAPAAEGVRARRGHVAHLIDRLCEELSRPRILSIAAGHLREASLCAAVKRQRFGRFVALDSDVKSLQVVEDCYGGYGVEAMMANVRRLIAGQLQLGRFDLVYSTGLFDYVGPAAARRLALVLFQMLRPAGRLVLANFLPGIRDAAYMEAFMDWQLIYRTRQEMMDITMEIPQREIAEITLHSEENQNIIFVQIQRS